ncbi:MAG: glycosyltransferase family 4 protein [Planctomycetia bacterium]|nr:glycosyltransferase family 4 protein [Planctomycetia bacterium]
MPHSRLSVVYLSPGAGGMYCGSCLSDNMLARALGRVGCDVTLVPLYTPTLTDEPNASIQQVFFGGLSVYLREKIPLVRRLPNAITRPLDAPWLLRLLGRRSIKTDASQLGELTLSMVRGEAGHQTEEIVRLVDWLKTQPRPDVINIGSLLVAGCVPALKRELGVPIIVTLQGDDQFLDALLPPYRDEALAELRRIARDVDGFIVHSRFYAEAMATHFEIPRERIHVVPLGLSLEDFDAPPPVSGRALAPGPPASPAAATATPPAASAVPLTVGYLARICPAKGLHMLVDAFLRLRRMPGMAAVRLRVAGWLGASDQAYFDGLKSRVAAAAGPDALQYDGAVDRAGKLAFLRGVDVLSVPTTMAEPKGRYVLEALAAGVPVVQPRHGAFPEMLEQTGGGVLFEQGDLAALADALYGLLSDPVRRKELGEQGRRGVREHHTDERSAQATLEVYRRVMA